MNEEHGIKITLLGKTYQIKCASNEIAALHDAANYLEQKLQSIRNRGKVLNAEQTAIMAALNVTHELQLLKDQESDYINSMSERIQNLHARIEEVIAETATETS